MQFNENAEVFTSTGEKVGRIDRVVIDPKSDELTHLVVKKGFSNWLPVRRGSQTGSAGNSIKFEHPPQPSQHLGPTLFNNRTGRHPPVQDPPNQPKKPPVEEPGDLPERPPLPDEPPVEEPPNKPGKPPVKEPPPHDPNRQPPKNP